jgi:hypothetical protein
VGPGPGPVRPLWARIHAAGWPRRAYRILRETRLERQRRPSPRAAAGGVPLQSAAGAGAVSWNSESAMRGRAGSSCPLAHSITARAGMGFANR